MVLEVTILAIGVKMIVIAMLGMWIDNLRAENKMLKEGRNGN